MRLAFFVCSLLASPALAGPPAAPASAPASASAPLPNLKGLKGSGQKARKPIKLYGLGGKPHPALKQKVKIDPAVLRRAVELHQKRKRAEKTSEDGRFRKVGTYWVRTKPTLDPTRATVTEWVHLVRGALRSAQSTPPKGAAPKPAAGKAAQ